jgi:Protein of unknown function (DUF4236)
MNRGSTMPFRFHKRVRLCKGLALNLSKSGASLSVGGKGVTTNVSRRGVRTTLSIPGTGISYQTRRRKAPVSFGTGMGCLLILGGLFSVLLLSGALHLLSLG